MGYMRMSFTITILLVISLLGIAVLGLFSMDHGNSHGGCWAITVNGADCPGNNGPIFFANFHLKAFQVFSTAVFNSTFSLLMVFGALLLLAGFWLLGYGDLQSPLTTQSQYQRARSFKLPAFESNLIRWLSLKENSPALF